MSSINKREFINLITDYLDEYDQKELWKRTTTLMANHHDGKAFDRINSIMKIERDGVELCVRDVSAETPSQSAEIIWLTPREDQMGEWNQYLNDLDYHIENMEFLRAVMSKMFNGVMTNQDIRDVLPDYLVEGILPDLLVYKRTRPAGFNVIKTEEGKKEFEKFDEIASIYAATRILIQ